jgi:hypothetical protein
MYAWHVGHCPLKLTVLHGSCTCVRLRPFALGFDRVLPLVWGSGAHLPAA